MKRKLAKEGKAITKEERILNSPLDDNVKDLGDIGELANEDDSSDDEGLDYDEESEDEIEKEGGNDESTEEEDVDEDEDEDEDEEESDLGTVSSDDLEWESGSEKEGDEANKNIREQKDTKRSKTNTSENNGKIIPSRELNSPQISKNVINKRDDKPVDEYNEGDTSDEEDIRNTVGNVPKEWYDEYRHLGYDWDGKKILKPEKGDQLDYFLKQAEDPNFWRTVVDPQTGQDVVLSDKDIELVQRMLAHKVPDPDYDEYPELVEWFSSDVMKMPLRKFPEHKRSFLPSKSEKAKVSKYVHALKMGWMKSSKMLKKEQKERERAGPQYYMLWQSDEVAEEMRRIHNHIPAPKRLLPGHAESYNPPEEFLFNEKELKYFNKEKKSLGKKKLHFVPQKYNSLREVPAYNRFIRERFMRCVDLYLCPRAIKMKLTIEPEDLVPQLPSPKDLQPFPNIMSLVFKGHTDMIRCISIDPKGQYLLSGSDDFTIKIWEVATGRCVRTVAVGGTVRSVAWCPNPALSLVAVAADRKCLLINPAVGDSLVVDKTDSVLLEPPVQEGQVPERVSIAVQWQQAEGEEWDNGIRVIVNHFKEIKQVTWHGRGDYFATVMPEGENRSVLIHQLSKRRSMLPFSRPKGRVQCVLFHPVRPFFFVATQHNVRVYDVVKQEMVKKLYSNSRWISSMAIHPGGDNLLVGTYDCKVLWFDLDLSTKPYKTLRLHSTAVRSVSYHRTYPLFASVSDDTSLIVSHGMVYNDLLQNALIVPLKRLSNHERTNDFGILDVMFHPTQPWVFTSGADATIRLYT
ncbi:ribosome biogenesis protein BOP1 homolog [Homalodisca vitripennis]|uniref:ribosome biogenesis protein BOP1 homolog n=1 Tax=Homalodisca vitripennis TaxID=197043 RepID=UPI001EEA1772|nr:ribosome biogenesis protein BOP1 homolog [Homalodisca vitripennis]